MCGSTRCYTEVQAFCAREEYTIIFHAKMPHISEQLFKVEKVKLLLKVKDKGNNLHRYVHSKKKKKLEDQTL